MTHYWGNLGCTSTEIKLCRNLKLEFFSLIVELLHLKGRSPGKERGLRSLCSSETSDVTSWQMLHLNVFLLTEDNCMFGTPAVTHFFFLLCATCWTRPHTSTLPGNMTPSQNDCSDLLICTCVVLTRICNVVVVAVLKAELRVCNIPEIPAQIATQTFVRLPRKARSKIYSHTNINTRLYYLWYLELVCAVWYVYIQRSQAQCLLFDPL